MTSIFYEKEVIVKMRERSINAQLREKILSLDSTGLRIEFFRPDEGMRVYHLGRGIIMDLAEEAGALYKGTAMPTVDNLVVLAAVLGVTIDEILVVDDRFQARISA